ncbi:NAD-dependent epimerase/dehydratase family protein [Bowmanella dokdonensis]|uniref:NAD-dependent epimerase/dehydratase family protein n=1 Tax=Bowmanella dokdonensis TaxID=751969 RepID=A0A939INT7_9ALTE|nr:NAD-dependent epimerase/dehydratase family protein [Bowmanella dokdonensis]MBN7826708.1 NAD-dependent epimerase/dehydratase family protein [Bowmanella dokdonensis]
MRVFLTGARGYVGRHIYMALVDSGIEVVALSREPLSGLPGESVVGELGSLGLHGEVIRQCDLIVHTAMGYIDDQEDSHSDLTALRFFLQSGVRILYTGNLFTCPSLPCLHEVPYSHPDSNWRNHAEAELLRASPGSAVVRLGFVYGRCGGHIHSLLPRDAEDRFYLPEQSGCWPMVHIDDVVGLYLKIIQEGASGIFHAATGYSELAEDIIRAVAKAEKGMLSPDKVALPFLQNILHASNQRSREIGWRPDYIRYQQEGRDEKVD